MLDYLRIMFNARLAKMDERGASAVEYGLLIAGIAALIVVVVFAFGGVIRNIFSDHVQERRPERWRRCDSRAADPALAMRPRTRTGPRPLHLSGRATVPLV